MPLGGNDPRLFHWAGVVLHAVAAWVLALTTWRVSRVGRSPAVTGVLFICLCAPFKCNGYLLTAIRSV